jgi:hypothetical protein
MKQKIFCIIALALSLTGCPDVTNLTKKDLTGTVTLDNHSPKVGDIITAAYAPGNGSGAQTWQWFRVGTGTEDLIQGAAANTYTVTTDDVGKWIKVQLSFADQISSQSAITTNAVTNIETTATLTGITAVYNGTVTIYPTTSINNLKTGLTVTANYSNNTSQTLNAADYTLSGTLTVGSSAVTVTYEGKTTTFNVIVSAVVINSDCDCNGNAEDCNCDNCDCLTCETPPVVHTVTFNADNGTTNTTQTVTEGGTATKPADPSKTYTPIGLYAGTPPTAYTFVEWQKPDGTAWNFTTDTVTANITLTAQWTSPSPIDITNETGNNIVEKAVSYVNANGGSEYTLVLGEDVSDVAPQTLDQDDTTLTITSDGNIERRISLGSNGHLFCIGDYNTTFSCNAKLVIDGYVTLEGKTDNSSPLVVVVLGCSLDLRGNAKITGNTTSECGGLVAYGESGVGKNVTITMSGNAEISNNGASQTVGGGVFLMGYTMFTMNDNATIKNNHANSNGGGVLIANNSTFTMNGGEISNNTATNNGGGVFVAVNTTFIVTNEQVKAGIHNNTATNGPQVFVYTDGTFTVGGEPADSF